MEVIQFLPGGWERILEHYDGGEIIYNAPLLNTVDSSCCEEYSCPHRTVNMSLFPEKLIALYYQPIFFAECTLNDQLTRYILSGA